MSLRPAAPAPDCKQQVVAAYHRLMGDDRAPSQQVYHLQFASASRYRAPGRSAQQAADTHGDLYYQGRRCFFQTEQLRLWQDERYVATVLPAQRTVFVTRVAPSRRLTTTGRLLGLRDSLLLLGTLQQCAPDEQARQRIRLTYAGTAGAQLHLKALTFWLSAADKLQQVKLEYRPESVVQETTFRFQVQEWLPGSAKLLADARQAVLTPQGQLLPAYAGYHLINQVSTLH